MSVESRIEELAQTLAGGSLRFEMPVRWGDLDALNHVNNTVYFRYMEEARVHFMRACGIGGANSGRNCVVAHLACDFLRPILWPATLEIDTKLLRVGRTSAEFEVTIAVKGDEGGPCARARNVLVGMDPATERPKPWTQAELEGIARVFTVAEA